MNKQQTFWFPAKRYGWGWGLPTCWQGWAVLIGFFALLALGVNVFEPNLHPIKFVLYVLALTSVLMLICWRTGEPARWRWGEDK